LRRGYEKHGDTYLLAGINTPFLRTTNAELIAQITTRKTDFPKPVDLYGLLNTFGKSILSVEGQEWRRHKKIVGSSFSEKSNRLVFEESLRQSEGMIDLWAKQKGNNIRDMRIEDTTHDTSTLSLHVICAAGFGVPQVWSKEEEEKAGADNWGFVNSRMGVKHTLSFKDSLPALLNALLVRILPPLSNLLEQ